MSPLRIGFLLHAGSQMANCSIEFGQYDLRTSGASVDEASVTLTSTGQGKFAEFFLLKIKFVMLAAEHFCLFKVFKFRLCSLHLRPNGRGV